MVKLGYPEPEQEPEAPPSAADVLSAANAQRTLDQRRRQQEELEQRIQAATLPKKQVYTIPGFRKQLQSVLVRPEPRKDAPVPLKKKKTMSGKVRNGDNEGVWKFETGKTMYISVARRVRKSLSKENAEKALLNFRAFFFQITEGMTPKELFMLIETETGGLADKTFSTYFRMEVTATLRAFNLLGDE